MLLNPTERSHLNLGVAHQGVLIRHVQVVPEHSAKYLLGLTLPPQLMEGAGGASQRAERKSNGVLLIGGPHVAEDAAEADRAHVGERERLPFRGGLCEGHSLHLQRADGLSESKTG